jgi:hypothetical protein
MRDDFTKDTARIIANRVSHRCSNPNCRRQVRGPHTESSKSINIGVAAHITAASPGGPRYDPNLTPDQRKSAANGIWLCQACAKLIDSDESRYSKALLLEWKQSAERAALREIEKLCVKREAKTLQEPDSCGKVINSLFNYTFSSSETFEKDITLLVGRIDDLKREEQSARNLGLKGSAEAARDEIQATKLQIQLLKKRIEIIGHGYEYWDEMGFLSACEACCLFDSWYPIGAVENGQFTCDEEFNFRIPQNILDALELAIESGLFQEFVLCMAVEPPDDPEINLAQWVGCYLFGSLPSLDLSENSDLFLIGSWSL